MRSNRREHPDRVAAWIERAAAYPIEPEDGEIALKRIDMIMAHDTLLRLGEMRQPTLVLCGGQDFCTPLPLSEEIAHAIPGAELVVVPDQRPPGRARKWGGIFSDCE
ncbi:hypothetical protein EPA93_35950 [Ktedonosporobacter rubrisoli]|uniref:Alpha/beta hydrolase n=1 Tax=Ktedonosporobacter rubrisoli TaxID=2509675 RepID=A0A4P6JYZ5_KTERU|nr:hypothetical protein [Ktedonosporobacter rubrisoli]QBD81078.1 hypothetical protein EPA93_35950 [Ktedonosporobacter rubrisoli]